VRDTGVGISREMLPRLFQPFTQADDTLDRSQGGLGLGLALVKGLVELHGGAVEVHSAGAAQGSEFVVRLPLPKLQSVASAQSADRAGRRAGKRQCRILIIDDNVDAALSLRDALELSDYVVETADTGAHGLQRARAFHPNVILCDIGLPVMDGYDVALAVRADSLLRNTYLVALTGYALPEDIAKAQAAGFNRHIAKPPKLDEIERAVAEGCGIDSARSHTGGIGSRPSNS
jgi:two-component system CheB/CheR fusion protein